MLATCTNVLFPGHNHLLTGTQVIIKVLGHQHLWLAGGYDLEIRHFFEIASMVVTWWIVAFLPNVNCFMAITLPLTIVLQ